MTKLTASEIMVLDPYTLLAVLGKKVIRPGGCGASETIFRMAGLRPDQKVLDIGCGVGTTALQISSRFGCQVTGIDIDSKMIGYAHENVRGTEAADRISLKQADMQALPFAENVFDAVTIEAVTMFTREHPASIREAIRVCRPGGYVFDHEFVWATRPPEDLRQIFETLVCTGMSFGTEHDWSRLFRSCGQTDVETVPVPFDMLTPHGMLRDEGLTGTLTFLGRAMSRWAYIKRLRWLIGIVIRVSPYLGSVVIASTKPGEGSPLAGRCSGAQPTSHMGRIRTLGELHAFHCTGTQV